MSRRVGLVLLLAVGGCGEKPETVAVGEAPPVAFPSARPRYAEGDTVYTDTLAADTRFADTLAAVRDSVAAEPGAPPPPSFDAFWTGVLASVRARRPLGGPGAEAARREPFRSVLLNLSSRDVSREGEGRVARAVVSFDAVGRAVPQDEAVLDSALVLRFAVVDGAWRLVRARLGE